MRGQPIENLDNHKDSQGTMKAPQTKRLTNTGNFRLRRLGHMLTAREEPKGKPSKQPIEDVREFWLPDPPPVRRRLLVVSKSRLGPLVQGGCGSSGSCQSASAQARASAARGAGALG